MRLTNAEKRRAVTVALNDPEWSLWSNVKIAKQCGVSDPFVMSVRASLLTVRGDEPDRRTYVTRHGTVATMDVSRIGRGVYGQKRMALRSGWTTGPWLRRRGCGWVATNYSEACTAEEAKRTSHFCSQIGETPALRDHRGGP